MSMWNGDLLLEASANNNLKSFFEKIFLGTMSKEDKIKIVQNTIWTAPTAITSQFTLRISTLRVMFQICPKNIFSSITATKEYIFFVCSVSESLTVNPALRGFALSVLSSTIRCLPHTDVNLLTPISSSIVFNLQYSSNLIKSEVSLSTAINPADIILHQCVEILTSIGESKAEWLKPLVSGVNTSAILLEQCSRNGKYSSTQRVVDVSKIFSMIAEVWLSQSTALEGFESLDVNNREMSSTTLPTIYNAPSTILKFLSSSGIVHDSFQSAFQFSLDICFELEIRTAFLNIKIENDLVSKMLLTLFQDCIAQINSLPLNDTVDLRRVESLLGYATSFFESYSEIKRCTLGISSPDKALKSIITLQQRMKESMQAIKLKIMKNEEDEESMTVEEEKDVRICCSDIRRGSIAAASCIILACPQWVVDDTDRYWSLCTVSLSTPLLFSAGYQAVSQSPSLQSASLTHKMLSHLQSALYNVSKYSSLAMEDILTAIKELCEVDCRELLPYTSVRPSADSIEATPQLDIPLALLRAYNSHPKTSGKTADCSVWKSAVINTVKEILHLHCTMTTEASSTSSRHKEINKKKCLPFTTHFSDLFVLSVMEDMFVLYIAMGITNTDVEDEANSLKVNKRIEKEHFGTVKIEALGDLLLSLTAAMISYLEVRALYDDEGGDKEKESNHLPSLSRLTKILHSTLDRQIVFEDDGIQLCCEADLIAKIAVRMWRDNSRSSSGSENSSSNSSSSILSAVEALCKGVETSRGNKIVEGGVEREEKEGKKVFSGPLYLACRDALLYIVEEVSLSVSSRNRGKLNEKSITGEGDDSLHLESDLTAIIEGLQVSDTSLLSQLDKLLPIDYINSIVDSEVERAKEICDFFKSLAI